MKSIWFETCFTVHVDGFCPVCGGLATVTAWQDSLTVGGVTIKSGDGWGRYKFTQISAGTFHTVAIDSNGDTWAWGGNGNGQLGDGATISSNNTPVRVPGGHKFTQITVGSFHTVAIDTTGQAWAWGKNDSGQLGDGTTTDKHAPVQVAGGHKFKQIAAGVYHTVAIDTNGDAWAWGYNRYGQLGDGTTINSPVPVQVAGGHKFRQISAGDYHTVAIDDAGDAWAWGNNHHGQLGDGTTNNSLIPVKVLAPAKP